MCKENPLLKDKVFNFRVQIYNNKTPLSSLLGKNILH